MSKMTLINAGKEHDIAFKKINAFDGLDVTNYLGLSFSQAPAQMMFGQRALAEIALKYLIVDGKECVDAAGLEICFDDTSNITLLAQIVKLFIESLNPLLNSSLSTEAAQEEKA